MISFVEPKEGLVCKAVILESKIEHASPCCNKIYQRFYCQNRIAEESWYHKVDASGDVTFNKKVNILNDYIVIPEFDKLLEVAESIDFKVFNY